MRFATVGLALVFMLMAGCSPGDSPEPQTDAARDSAIAESAIPGAAGVRSALSTADSAAARRAREDSIMSADDQ
ncbi:MAG: hypothetical protein HKP01_03325 [Gemmatimonadetes bacterium]|nr:hypothetical protein [Gemmatimonadota bacterium]